MRAARGAQGDAGQPLATMSAWECASTNISRSSAMLFSGLPHLRGAASDELNSAKVRDAEGARGHCVTPSPASSARRAFSEARLRSRRLRRWSRRFGIRRRLRLCHVPFLPETGRTAGQKIPPRHGDHPSTAPAPGEAPLRPLAFG
jgi:hypothetical protein